MRENREKFSCIDHVLERKYTLNKSKNNSLSLQQSFLELPTVKSCLKERQKTAGPLMIRFLMPLKVRGKLKEKSVVRVIHQTEYIDFIFAFQQKMMR